MSDIDDVVDLVRSIILRGKLKSVDPSQDTQGMYVETLADDGDDAQHFQPYGLRGVPSAGDIVVIKIGGSEDDHVVIVASGTGAPTDLVSDEVAYWSKIGQRIVHRTDGNTYHAPKAGARVVLGTEDSVAAKALAIAEKVELELEALRTIINTHTHVVSGITAGPGSVASATGLPQAGAIGNTASSNVDGKV